MEKKNKIFIGGLHEIIDEKILYDIFSIFGEIQELTVPLTSQGSNKGIGFITYIDEKDAEQALLNMNKSELYGKQITVNYQRS